METDDNCNLQNKKIMGTYLNLLCDKDMEKSIKIERDLDIPRPSDLFRMQ